MLSKHNVCPFFFSCVALSVYSGLAAASSVSPSEVFIDDPGKVLMIDGKDNKNADVMIKTWLDAPSRAAYDFGYFDNGFVHIAGGYGYCDNSGTFTFSGGTLVDFTVRNWGTDSTFGTDDDLLFRLSDANNYAAQHYFAPIKPSKSRNPEVDAPYYYDLRIAWDFDLDGVSDAHTLIETQKKFDGMAFVSTPTIPPPTPNAVPVPAAIWLLGSGLGSLMLLGRRKAR